MDAVDPEFLEEAKEPPRRSGKRFGAFAAMAACFVLLVVGVMVFQPGEAAQDPQQGTVLMVFQPGEAAQDPQQGTVQLANPVQTVTDAELTQLGYRIPLPAGAQNTTYQLIALGQDAAPMAQVSFRMNDKDYTCRALKADKAEDISGIYQEWAEKLDWAVGELQMQMRKAADLAWVGWFSVIDGMQWCVSGDPDTVLHTARTIVETLGYQMAVAPADAEQVEYDVLVLDDLTVGETTFVLDNIRYSYRTAATLSVAEDFADISGLPDRYPVNKDTAVSYCSARLSFEDGGSGKIVWFDPVPGLLYSLSMDSGASSNALTDMAGQLFTPAQGEVG